MQEHEEKYSFLAFRSDSQTLVDTQKLVAPQQFHVIFVIFVREPLVSTELTFFMTVNKYCTNLIVLSTFFRANQ